VTVMIDSSAWLEYFFGSKKGEKVNEIIQSKEVILSNPIVEFEILHKITKMKTKRLAETYLGYVSACSQRMDLFQETISLSVELKHKFKLGMADSLIAGTALASNAKIVTTDNDFRKIKNAEIL